MPSKKAKKAVRRAVTKTSKKIPPGVPGSSAGILDRVNKKLKKATGGKKKK